MSDLETLERILLERSVRRGDFTLASGQRSSYYIDARITTMSAEGLRLVGHLGLEAIRQAGWQPEVVGGLTMGADPVAYAVAIASLNRGTDETINAFSVRKAAKEHGTKRRIEGNFSVGCRVVVVEDVITSGASAIQAIEVVEQEGGQVLGVLAVVDRQQGGREVIVSKGYSIVALTTTNRLGLETS